MKLGHGFAFPVQLFCNFGSLMVVGMELKDFPHIMSQGLSLQ